MVNVRSFCKSDLCPPEYIAYLTNELLAYRVIFLYQDTFKAIAHIYHIFPSVSIMKHGRIKPGAV